MLVNDIVTTRLPSEIDGEHFLKEEFVLVSISSRTAIDNLHATQCLPSLSVLTAVRSIANIDPPPRSNLSELKTRMTMMLSSFERAQSVATKGRKSERECKQEENVFSKLR